MDGHITLYDVAPTATIPKPIIATTSICHISSSFEVLFSLYTRESCKNQCCTFCNARRCIYEIK